MKPIPILTFFFLLFMTISCSDLKQDEHLKRLNKLEMHRQRLADKINSEKLDTLPQLVQSVYQVENRLKKYLLKDTIDLALGKKLDAYKLMKNNFKPLRNQLSEINKSLEEEKITLNNLEIDIKNGSGHRDQYPSYLVFEKNKIKQIEVLINQYIELKKNTLSTYDEVHAELNEFSLQLMHQKNLN